MPTQKEYPIIFNAEMVRAILDGSKTQSRRVITPQPTLDGQLLDFWTAKGRWRGTCIVTETNGTMLCPYGQVGNRLWVRETLYKSPSYDVTNGKHFAYYQANHLIVEGGRWEWQKSILPSIFMPRWASRITLEFTEVRVEKVQGISPDDAMKEGITRKEIMDRTGMIPMGGDLILAFHKLWDSLNAKRKPTKYDREHGITEPITPSYAWANNPWVWVISFRVELT